MKILYISQIGINLKSNGLYSDLINSLVEKGHEVTLLTAAASEKSYFDDSDEVVRCNVKIAEQYGVSFIKKGLVLLSMGGKIIKAIKKYLGSYSFDLVLYATPPITLAKVVKYCKKKYRCKSFLMLKDIFPQNAVDIGIMHKHGIMGIIYRMFKQMEKKLYSYSDRIGCTSQANIDYIREHNKEVDENKLEIFYNAVLNIQRIEKDKSILQQHGIDTGKITFIYGGNLGRPQGLGFLADALQATQEYDCNFVIAGSGQDKEKFFAKIKNFRNVYTFDYLPQKEYNQLCASCDVGMVILDYRFTVPNCPARTLSCMQCAIPILACTDKATDIKELIEEQANCGKWCYSNDAEDFCTTVQWFIDNQALLHEMGENGYNYLKENFMVANCVKSLEDFMQVKEV